MRSLRAVLLAASVGLACGQNSSTSTATTTMTTMATTATTTVSSAATTRATTRTTTRATSTAARTSTPVTAPADDDVEPCSISQLNDLLDRVNAEADALYSVQSPTLLDDKLESIDKLANDDNLNNCLEEALSMTLWQDTEYTDMSTDCPWSCDDCVSSSGVTGPYCEEECLSDPCCVPDATQCCKPRPLMFLRPAFFASDPDVLIPRCLENASKADDELKSAAEDLQAMRQGEVGKKCKPKKDPGQAAADILSKSLKSINECFRVLTDGLSRLPQQPRCGSSSDCYMGTDPAGNKVPAACVGGPQGKSCAYESPEEYMPDCLVSKLDPTLIGFLKVGLQLPANATMLDFENAMRQQITAQMCVGPTALRLPPDNCTDSLDDDPSACDAQPLATQEACEQERVCNWDNGNGADLSEAECLSSPEDATNPGTLAYSQNTSFCSVLGTDIGAFDIASRTRSGCAGICTAGYANSAAACAQLQVCTGDCIVNGVTYEGCMNGSTLVNAAACTSYGMCVTMDDQVPFVSTQANCESNRTCEGNPMYSGAECEACGLDWQPLNTFVPNQLLPGSWVNAVWTNRSKVSRNKWTTGLNTSALGDLLEQAIVQIQAQELASSVKCTFGPVVTALQNIHCMCNYGIDLEECQELGPQENRPVAEGLLLPGVPKTIASPGTGSVEIVMTSSVGQQKVIMEMSPAALQTSDEVSQGQAAVVNGNSTLNASVARPPPRRAGNRRLAWRSEEGQPRRLQGGGAVRASFCGFDVVKNATGAVVAQLVSDGVGFRGVSDPAKICILPSARIPVNPCRFCGRYPVFAMRNNSNVTVLPGSVTLEGGQYCSTVRGAGTYYLAFAGGPLCPRPFGTVNVTACPACVSVNLTARAQADLASQPPTAQTITGSLSLNVPNVTAFLADRGARLGVQRGIANASAVPQNLVSVILTASRRLSGEESRRLQAGGIAASYTITVPTSMQTLNVSTISNRLQSQTAATLQAALQTALRQTMQSPPTITVTAVTAPQVSAPVVITAASTTMMADTTAAAGTGTTQPTTRRSPTVSGAKGLYSQAVLLVAAAALATTVPSW